MFSNHQLQDLQTSHTHTHFVWLNIWLKTSPCDFLPFILVLYMIWTQIENKKKQLSLLWHLWPCDTLCSTQTAAGCSWKESWRHFDAFLSCLSVWRMILLGVDNRSMQSENRMSFYSLDFLIHMSSIDWRSLRLSDNLSWLNPHFKLTCHISVF